MTKFMQKSFSVGASGTDTYRENWERTFRGKTPLREQVEDALKLGTLEAAANEEYYQGRYHPEKGGPALAKLNEERKRRRRK